VLGVNPCGEQSLEDQECCTLVETFPTNCTDLDDYKATLKHAYMYAKAVTLLPTHWPETNEIMQRNRRIGCSMSGIAQFGEIHGWNTLQQWMDAGYLEVGRRDRTYSEWLGCRESVKMTSVKPSGTVSLLAGVWPGVHWPEFELYFRRMRFRSDEMLVPIIIAAGYHVEPDVMDPEHTVVATFPTMPPQGRSTRDVSVWEKAELAALAQHWWADNQVSATITFREDERNQIGPLLRAFDGRLKSVSFMPISEKGVYAQMPYEAITDEQYAEAIEPVTRFELAKFYRSGEEARGERFCSNDSCEL
jgi:adenosylcobalamin-dependent ribonucleoside-triphosphate reductase